MNPKAMLLSYRDGELLQQGVWPEGEEPKYTGERAIDAGSGLDEEVLLNMAIGGFNATGLALAQDTSAMPSTRWADDWAASRGLPPVRHFSPQECEEARALARVRAMKRPVPMQRRGLSKSLYLVLEPDGTISYRVIGPLGVFLDDAPTLVHVQPFDSLKNGAFEAAGAQAAGTAIGLLGARSACVEVFFGGLLRRLPQEERMQAERLIGEGFGAQLTELAEGATRELPPPFLSFLLPRDVVLGITDRLEQEGSRQ